MADRAYVFRLLGDSSGLQTSIDASVRSVEQLSTSTDRVGATAAVATGRLRPVDGAVQSLGISAGQTSNAIRLLPAQLTDVVTQLAGGQNPLLILIQQGGQVADMFGGIGPAFKALAGFISPTIAVAGGLAAGLGTVAFAAYKGATEVDQLNNILQLSGNYAGLTAGSFDALASSIAASTDAGLARSKDILRSLVATGQVGATVLEPMGRAVALVSKLSGQAADDVTRDFARMQGGVAAWAAEHNKQYNFLSGEQYAYIKRLEEQGDKERAAIVTLSALTDRLGVQLPSALGNLGAALKFGGDLWDRYWARAMNVGKPETVEDKLAAIDAKLRQFDAQGPSAAKPGEGYRPTAGLEPPISAKNAEDLRTDRRLLLMDQLRGANVALERAETARVEKARIGAIDIIDRLKDQTRGTALVTSEVEKYRRQVALLKGTSNEVSAAEQAAQEAALRKKYAVGGSGGRTAAQRLDTRFDDRLQAFAAEGIKLDAEIRSYELYGRALDKARVGVLDLEVAQGKLKGLDAGRIATLRAAAAADDAKDRALDLAKVNAEVAKSISALRTEAQAKSESAREGEVSRRVAEMEAKGVKVGTAAYVDNAAQIRLWVDVKHDALLARQIAAGQAQTNAEVAQLDRETQALGMSTVERRKAAVALELYAEAQRQIAVDPSGAAAINDAMVAQRDALTAAIDRNYTASRRFEVGAASAMQRYREEAGDAAGFADRTIGGGLQKLEDAVVEFAKTGKLNFKDLFQFMVDEFIRQQARMALAKATEKGGWLETVIGLAGAYFGAGDTGVATNTTGTSLPTSGGRADGGAVAPNSLQPVNERGPELLSTSGKDYLMMGGSGGFVTPVTKAASVARPTAAAAPPTVVINVKNEAGDVAQASAQQNDDGSIDVLVRRVEQRIGENVARNRGPVSSGLRTRGVNMNASLARIG